MSVIESLKKKIRPKIKKERKPKSKLFYLIMFLLIITALNFALLLPSQISNVFLEVELFFLQTARQPIRFLQVWSFILLIVMTSAFGYNLFPRVKVSSIGEYGKTYFYRRKWIEDDTRFFKTWLGYVIGVNEKVVTPTKFGLAYHISANVKKNQDGNFIALETEELEVTRSVHEKKRAEYLMEQISILYDSLENQEVPYSKDELSDMMKNKWKANYERKD